MPPEQIIARDSPGVFKVVEAGNFTIAGPDRAFLTTGTTSNPLTGPTVVPNGTPRVMLDYQADLKAGKVTAAGRLKYVWQHIADNPDATWPAVRRSAATSSIFP
jgi:hypothetical protein